MKIRRFLVGGAAALVVAGAFSATVFASGWGQAANAEAAVGRYQICAVEDCTRVGNHAHDGVIFAPHDKDDGHSYHNTTAKKPETKATTLISAPAASQESVPPASYELCPVEDCTQTGNHNHDGVTYTPHHDADGHAYHNPAPVGTCPVQGCGLTGDHEHDGILYTAHHNADGHNYHDPAGVCPVQGCDLTGNHEHDGVLYGAHHNADGHGYHSPSGVCPVQGCGLTGNHEHDGVLYGGHHNEDGHNYHGQASHESSSGHHNGGGGSGGRGGHH